jgi:hypothetical protein
MCWRVGAAKRTLSSGLEGEHLGFLPVGLSAFRPIPAVNCHMGGEKLGKCHGTGDLSSELTVPPIRNPMQFGDRA